MADGISFDVSLSLNCTDLYKRGGGACSMADGISFDVSLSLNCTDLYKRGGGA